MPRTGPSPWLMWGSAQTIVLPGGDAQPRGGQLCQIDYRRPETWHFLIYGVVTRTGGTIDPGTVLNIDLALTIGLGRTTIPLPNFCRLTWGPGPNTLQANQFRACTTVEFPKENTTRVSNNIVNEVVFQNLQSTFNAAFVEADESATAEVQLTMFWAPKSHVRPEWFSSPHAHFPGGEAVGR